MLEKMFGFKEENIPFFNMKSLNDAWEQASSVVIPEIAESYRERFERKFNLNNSVLQVLNSRYNFYLQLLDKDPDIKQYSEEIGETMLTKRVVFALHNTLNKSYEFASEIESIIRKFPSYCLEKELAKDQILFGSLMGSDCEISGVCICRGSKRPYISGCINDSSLLLLDSFTAKSRFNKTMGQIADEVLRSHN